jgi:hypothetical protein
LKFLLLAALIFPSISLAAEKLDAATQELLLRGVELKPADIILVCSDNNEWCNGYFVAIIHELEKKGVNLCLPRNEVGRQIDEGVWSIIESWLYRQPKESKTSLNNAVVNALTEHNDC